MGNINKIMGPHLNSILYIIRHILTVGKPDKRRGDYKHLSLIIFRVDWKFFAMKLKDTCPWKKSYDQHRQHIKKQRHYFADKDPSSQSFGFFSSHVWM